MLSKKDFGVRMPIPILASMLTVCSGDDLRGIFVDPNNLADSPDLGPPPIAHFDEGDPIKFDPNNDKQCLDETPTAVLSANLETRKKRRESFHQREPSRLGDGTDPDRRRIPDEKAASVQPLKSGAKRKLDIREEGDRPTIDMENDNFRISRKVSEPELTATKSKVGSKGRTDSSKGNDVRDEKVLDSIERSKETRPAITSTGRKVLGPKSVNSDPQSPAKLAKPSTKPKISDGKDDLMKRIRDRSESKDKQPSGKIQKIVREVEIPKAKPAKPTELPPKTPIPPDLDLLSPTASDPSEPRPGLRDTPPPPDLGPDTGTDSFGRASRRPRCSVSYAEPNLRAKMRRPTKDMVDAVGAEEKIRQAADKKRKGSVSSMETDFERLKLDSTIVKQEEENESSPIWKTKALQDSHSQKERQRAETTSPLGKKAGLSASDLPASVITDRRERVSSMSRKDAAGEQIQPSSGAATAIAALAVTGPKGRRREAGNGATNMKEVAPVVESGDRTSIFDFTGSSPEDVDKRSKSKEELEESTKTLRVLRRHSSVPGNSDRGKGSITISRRRRETILETSELAGELDTSMRHEVESMKSAAVPEWSTGDDRVLGRGERAANRRRSMML